MRKLLGFLLLSVAVFSCREPLLDSLPRHAREPNRYARGSGEGEDSQDKPNPDHPQDPDAPEYVPTLYATALHFRDSVNWRQDSLGLADLLFFKEKELVLSLPVSSPPDPERHRIWDGHLWSDSTDGRQTVVYCDGQEQFRFEGEEHLQGFLLLNGDVHTLGQRPGRNGFCYRINGKAVFSSSKGSVLGHPADPEWRGGALTLDGNDVYYCYSLPVTLKDRVDREYHVMKGGEAFKTIPAGTSSALYDLRVHQGKVHRIERRITFLYWIVDEEIIYINTPTSSLLSCKLVRLGDGLAVKGKSGTSGSACVNWYWDASAQSVQAVCTASSAQGMLARAENNWAFADMDTHGLVQSLHLNLPTAPPVPPGMYNLATPTGLFVSAQYTAVALTHGSGNTHLVISNKGLVPYQFNGYFTSVRLE